MPLNATFVTVSFFGSDGSDYTVSGQNGTQRSYLQFAVPNCTATTDAFALVLIFWNTTKGDWDNSGVNRDDAAILASGDNCTFIGYTTHFTTFSIGFITIQINDIDPVTVRVHAEKRMGAGYMALLGSCSLEL